jgi:hypothetical protein
MGSRRHIMAVNRTIKALNLGRSDAHAPEVEMARDLARQLDLVGIEGFARLAPIYRSVLKELKRTADDFPAQRPSLTAVPQSTPEPADSVNLLDRIRRDKKNRVFRGEGY